MKKLVYAAVILAALALIGWHIWRKASAKKGGRRRGPTAVAVEIAPVRQAPIRDVGLFTGSLSARYRFVVAPKIAGRLRRLQVDVGDPVTKGQEIAWLENEEYAQNVRQARAELDVARARLKESQSSLDVAQREFARYDALFRKNISSASDLDVKKSEFQVAEAKRNVASASVAQKEAELKAVEVRLSYTRVRASWDAGVAVRVVGERYVDEGAMLKANEPIVSVLDISALKAVIYAIERDYPKLRVGQTALLATDAFPRRRFKGKVARVAPLLRESSRQARVEIEVPNPGQALKPGMFIRAEIEFVRREKATVVPVSALARRKGRRGVFVADLKTLKARFVAVETGIVSRDLAEVTRPALSGWVVTLGQHLLADGAEIALPGGWKPKASAAPPARREGRKP